MLSGFACTCVLFPWLLTLQYLDNSIPDISWETSILSSPENAFTLKFGRVLIFCLRVTSAKSSHDITSVIDSFQKSVK